MITSFKLVSVFLKQEASIELSLNYLKQKQTIVLTTSSRAMRHRRLIQ